MSYRPGQRVKLHGLEWFRLNDLGGGRFTLKGRYEYDEAMVAAVAGRWARIMQWHGDVGLYDILIGHTIYQVEALFFNDRRKYDSGDGRKASRRGVGGGASPEGGLR